MVDEEDIELVRTGYSAFVAGDKEWLNEHLHVNVVWHAAGKGSRAGEYRGREEVLASFANSVQAVYIKDRRIGRTQFSEVFAPLFSRPSSNKALKVEVRGFPSIL
jgi:ketosteroid isomerase-like protein